MLNQSMVKNILYTYLASLYMYVQCGPIRLYIGHRNSLVGNHVGFVTEDDVMRGLSSALQVPYWYHADMFEELARVHRIVTILLPPTREAAVQTDSDGHLPASCLTSGVRLPHDSSLIPCRPIYSTNPTDGRWKFGRLPAKRLRHGCILHIGVAKRRRRTNSP